MSDLGPVNPGHAEEAAWLRRWRLRPDADPVTTASSTLIPVRTEHGEPAMLKLAQTDEEARGADLLVALDGRGAARVLEREGPAVLIERATGDRDLVRMVEAGHDDEATRIICAAAEVIHAASTAVLAPDDPPGLVRLATWFRHLRSNAEALGAFHRRGADTAARLLADPRDTVVLHGDLHHGNVLDFGERGWLVIDPKGLLGEAAFDYCNLLCNPSHERALAPGRLQRQFGVVVDATGVDAARLADWLVAWCALSSTWFEIDDDPRLAASAAAIGEGALELRREAGAPFSA
ncbi:aminoglycoside phosphotransferase family protein [Agromyces neolithicus]|uniref:Aminoglycoside phosphotransferase family protein n=1 Tax=Agromyces neolithicus TaxID=269420 RepID=A0ABN2M2N4_9MICO